MSENEKTKRFFIITIIVAILIIAMETVTTIEALKENSELTEQKKDLEMQVQYQKSVIMDLEEDLRKGVENERR